MFYRYGYAENPTITRCRSLINEAMAWDDTTTLAQARQLLDMAVRAQRDLMSVNVQLDECFIALAARVNKQPAENA